MLSVDSLVKTYPATGRAPAVPAVRGLSFEVGRGEFFGLLGPNGAGKSTTLGCITTLIRPTSGRIAVAGVYVDKDPAAAKRRLAVVPQSRNLDRDLTVREILVYHGRYFGLGRGAAAARADRLLAELELTDKADARPRMLSGGLQQRVMIARALMHDPEVLLLDEPTAGLDPQARRRVWTTLVDLHRRGMTIILTTHYMEEVDQLCQRLAIVDKGSLVALDTPSSLKRRLPGRVLDLRLLGEVPLASRLALVPGVLRVEAAPQADGGGPRCDERLKLFIDAKDGALDRVLATVRGAGAELEHVSLTAPSLEDVYIDLTGKGLVS